MTVWLESIYATKTPATGLLSLVIVVFSGYWLPEDGGKELRDESQLRALSQGRL